MEKFLQKHIFIDLDGTIIDSQEGLVGALKYALEKFKILNISDELLRSFIGPPLRQSIPIHFPLLAPPENFKVFINYHRFYYSQKGIYDFKFYPNILKSIEYLKFEKNKKIYIATSKPLKFAHKIIVFSGVKNLFQDIIGSNLNGSLIYKEEIINYALKKHNINPEDALMIGDRFHDIKGAVLNNIHSIGVTYGYGQKDEFLVYKPQRIINSPSELINIF